MKRLEEICIFIRNGLNIKNDKSKKGIPITRIETISNGIIDINKTGYANIFNDKYIDYYLRQDDILMSHINSLKHLGKVGYCYYDMKIIHGMNLLNIRVNPNNVYPKYLYYYFKSNNFKIKLNKISKQSVNQSSFSISDLKKIRIDIIDLKKQKLIVSKLDKVVEVISIRKKQIEELNNLIKSQFVEMFGNGNYPQIRLKEVLNQNDNMEKVENTKIEKFVTIGINGKGARERIIKDGKWPVPFVGYRVKGGQFIYSRIDARNGAFAIIPNSLNNAVVSKDFPIFNIDNNKIRTDILLFSLLEKSFIDKIKNSSFGATNRQRIKEQIFLNYKIYLPPITLQNQFSEIVKQIDKQKFESMIQLKMMEKIYNIINDRRRYV